MCVCAEGAAYVRGGMNSVLSVLLSEKCESDD